MNPGCAVGKHQACNGDGRDFEADKPAPCPCGCNWSGRRAGDIIADMPTTRCPFCENRAHMTLRWGEVYDHASLVRFAATCDECGEISSAAGEVDATSIVRDTSTTLDKVAQAIRGWEEGLEWWPKQGESPEVPDVPDAIAAAATEAYSSASVGNHMAAILMARTVVEATAKHKGITSGMLVNKINAMRDQQLIRPAIAEQAHEVRYLGNDMAHGDIEDMPSAIDSEEILALMAEVLSEVFQGPARLARIRARRIGESS